MNEDIDKKLEPILASLSEDEKKEVIAQIGESLMKRLIIRIYDHLNETDQKILDELNETADPEKINEFFKLKVPDLESIRDEELETLISEMKEFIGAK
ncbi:MAG: DUF5663 domain-containing protein [Candidatus Paceibacterota bacterium]|jgi:predicted P-loop ATPase/GTPase